MMPADSWPTASIGVVDIVMANRQATDIYDDVSDHAWLYHELGKTFDPDSAVHFSDMIEVSDMLMAGYARFVGQGMPREMVGFAMLGATMNLYDLFGMQASLPKILRGLADRIDQKTDTCQR